MNIKITFTDNITFNLKVKEDEFNEVTANLIAGIGTARTFTHRTDEYTVAFPLSKVVYIHAQCENKNQMKLPLDKEDAPKVEAPKEEAPKVIQGAKTSK